MDTVMPEEALKEVLDLVTRKVTKDAGGIHLLQGESKLGKDVCTVHIRFRRGFRSSLSFRADTVLFIRLTQSILKKERITPRELEDVTKEYFNVLCGHIAAALYKITRVASRFSVPAFYPGSYSPEGHEEQFVLHYASDRREAAQLVHHIPAPRDENGGTR